MDRQATIIPPTLITDDIDLHAVVRGVPAFAFRVCLATRTAVGDETVSLAMKILGLKAWWNMPADPQ